MIRITGIVKTAERVRNKLHQGVNPQEISALKDFVAYSLQSIEKICTEADTSLSFYLILFISYLS